MPRTMRPFSLLIKPAGADCNLRCDHCFYLCKQDLYPAGGAHRMPDAVLEALIAGYLATEQPQYVFGWQGGEPTLMGLDFFRRVTELQQRHGRPGSSVANGLQTNATRIDDAMAAHFGRFNFLLGVSVDGPEAVHDRYRRNAAGAGSYADAMRGIEALRRQRVEFNTLTLVTQSNVRAPAETYAFLRERDFLHQQYIPCVEFDPAGGLLPFSITGAEWGEFLCGVFDAWAAADSRTVSIRLFDAIVARLLGLNPSCCTMMSDCRQYFVVEHTGDIYPCDFYVEPALRLGNVADARCWEQAAESPLYTEFGRRKAKANPVCGACGWRELCAGDCPKFRVADREGWLQPSWLCEGWKLFFAHAVPRLRELAADVARERKLQVAREQRSGGPPGRNDLCHCGSGRKFKKCCGRG